SNESYSRQHSTGSSCLHAPDRALRTFLIGRQSAERVWVVSGHDLLMASLLGSLAMDLCAVSDIRDSIRIQSSLRSWRDAASFVPLWAMGVAPEPPSADP